MHRPLSGLKGAHPNLRRAAEGLTRGPPLKARSRRVSKDQRADRCSWDISSVSNEQHRASSALRPAALTSATVAVAGFGVMNAFWATQVHDGALRGLYDYLSASYGDALLLPAASGAVVYIRSTLPLAKHERRVGMIAAAAGMLAGAALQVAWLIDDNPELNWTLPAPHQMNAAGIYHAAFLTGMSAFTTWLVSTTAARALAVEAPFGDPRRRRAFGVATCAGAAFVVLLVVDNRAASGLAQGASLSAIGLAVAAAAGGVAWLRRRTRGGRE